MKRLISLLAVALFGVALVGCSDNEETTPPTPPDPEPVDVYGWHMTKWEVGGDDTNFPKEVYIVFDEEKNFEMYQDVSSNGFVKMTGTYTFDETSKKLTGKYSDDELTCVYGIIPDEVINSVMVRSAEGVRIL